MKVIAADSGTGIPINIEIEENDVHVVNPPNEEGETADAGSQLRIMTNRLEAVGETIAGMCNSASKQILGILGDARPSEITLEFGIKLGGEAGIPIITKASVEGSFQVSATWKLKQGD